MQQEQGKPKTIGPLASRAEKRLKRGGELECGTRTGTAMSARQNNIFYFFFEIRGPGRGYRELN